MELVSIPARWLAWLFGLLGLAASSTSLIVHYRLLTRPGYASFCDVSEAVSCTQAYLSPYGSVLGVPVALAGVIWFVFVLALLLVEWKGPRAVAENVAAYVFVSSTVGLAAILYLAYAAFFVLKVVCLLCLVTYVGVIGLFLTSGLASAVPMTSLPRRIGRDLRALVTSPIAVAVTLLFAGAAATAVAFFPREANRSPIPGLDQQGAKPDDLRVQFEAWYDQQPKVTVPVSAFGAAVLIVKYTDFQCPMCAQTHFEFKSVLAKYQSQVPGAVRFISKMYPLQPECNVNVPGPFHTAACDAAVAWIMARDHGRAEAMEDWLYGNQSMLSPATVREAARTVGQIPNFDPKNARAIEEIKSDVALGRLLNVHSTPTFFINGTVIIGGIAAQYFDMAIAYELRKAGKIK